MSRKHFKALAENLKAERPDYDLPVSHAAANRQFQWDKDVAAVAKVCTSFNPQFNHAKFYEACGGLFTTIAAAKAA
jgi:hypothetical protein